MFRFQEFKPAEKEARGWKTVSRLQSPDRFINKAPQQLIRLSCVQWYTNSEFGEFLRLQGCDTAPIARLLNPAFSFSLDRTRQNTHTRVGLT